jgi:anti-sigma factor RsiW
MTQEWSSDGSHARCRDLLSDYLDGLLADPDRRLLERHLEGCAECARVLAGLRATLVELHSFPRLEVPADFSRKVLESTSLQERAPAPWKVLTSWLGLPRPSPAAAAALLAFPLIFLAGTPGGRLMAREASMAAHQTYSNAVRLYSRRDDLQETAVEMGRKIPGQLEETVEWLKKRIEPGDRGRAPQSKPGEPGQQSNRTFMKDSTA